MQSFDPAQKKHILRQFRHSGVCLDDAVVVNVLYLMHDLQATLSIAIIDPLVLSTLAKRERTCASIKKRLHEDPHVDILLMPLILNKHWSLLVFIPSLSGYIHFDSIRGLHDAYAKRLLTLLDNETHYRKLPVHSSYASQQESDWECGFFVLMNAFMFIHMKRDSLYNEDTLRLYLARHSLSVCERKVRRFALKIYTIVSSM